MTVLLKNGEYSYEIERGLLGKGSFGSVYKGLITKTNDVVAIKAMSLSLIQKYGPDIKQIIKNEVAVLKELSNKMYHTPCPFIIRIYDCFLTENNIYIVLEFCGEGDLNRILNKRKRLPEAQGIEVIYHIVRALDFLKMNNVCHRDLKPQNIFITRNSDQQLIFKVGDFGFAVSSAINSQQVGTFPYMSPQLLRGEDYGSEVDVWALGVIAHQILFGQSYFIGRNESEVKNNVLNKQYIIKEEKLISKQMCNFLYGCLQKDKKKRLRTQQLRSHPVFKNMEMKYSNIEPPMARKDSKDTKDQARASSLIQNELNKAIFLQELARNILVVKRMNCISIYLIKSSLYRIKTLTQQLMERANVFNIQEPHWSNLTNSNWYKQFTRYCQQMYDGCKKFFDTELVVFNNTIKNFDQNQIQVMMYNLGNGDLPPNGLSLAQDLLYIGKMLHDMSDSQGKLLSLECILAIKIDKLKYDFGKHLRDRTKLDTAVIENMISSMEA